TYIAGDLRQVEAGELEVLVRRRAVDQVAGLAAAGDLAGRVLGVALDADRVDIAGQHQVVADVNLDGRPFGYIKALVLTGPTLSAADIEVAAGALDAARDADVKPPREALAAD